MNAERFIASKLGFKGRLAGVAICVSFFVIALALAVCDGFRREIRLALAETMGDIQLTMDGDCSSLEPVELGLECLESLDSLDCVESLTPAVYRTGIIRVGDEIEGVLVKGVECPDSSRRVRIPRNLSERLGLKEGDAMTTYFISSKLQARKFKVDEIYDSPVETDRFFLVYTPIEDMRRLNGWDENKASAVELKLRGYRNSEDIRRMGAIAGNICYKDLVALSAPESYPDLFQWMRLIDSNVTVILILMIIVAGFNMISGLLILLFRSISTIGILKSMGMGDKSIAKVFLMVSSRLVLAGMFIGNAAALLFCFVQSKTHLLKLNPANYFVSFVPVDINAEELVLINVMAFAAILLLMTVPCLFISKIDPAVTARAD